MGILGLKNVVKKALSSSRYVPRSIEFFSPKRHLQLDNTNKYNYSSGSEIKKQLPLVRRLHDNNDRNGIHYFSQLSTENLTPQKQIHLPFPKIAMVGSCNGVLCVEDGERNGRLGLYNPSSNEFRFLPLSCIKCGPSASLIDYRATGFGYDFSTRDYKVIRLVNIVYDNEEGCAFRDRTELHAELYSLNSDSWKEIPDRPDRFVWGLYSCSTCVNGVFYWLATRKNEHEILSFGFGNQEFSTIALPGEALRKGVVPYLWKLLEWDGSLGFIMCPAYGPEKKLFDLWVRNGDSWHHVSNFTVAGAVRPLDVWSKNQLIYESIHHEAILLDLDTREERRLGIYDYPETLEFVPCVESRVQLYLPKSENKEPSKGETFHEQIQTVP